jgi:DNA-binding GntR family transcriptional regulator
MSSSTAAKLEEHNFRFHSVINHIAERPRLRWFLRAATHYVPRHYYEAIPGALPKTLEEHPAIIEALRTHDRRQARALVERHVADAGELLIDQLSLRGFWSDPAAPRESGASQTRRI